MKKLPFLFLLLVCCSQNTATDITVLCSLPKALGEVSGIHTTTSGHSFHALEDSGNDSVVYEIGLDGKKKNQWAIPAENTDWEDITSDQEGNLYIGDFGNNKNTRKDLAIYKVAAADLKNNAVKSIVKTSFSYPEQTQFPPKKTALIYDCEAFFESGGSFYLFTKNRSKGFDGSTLLYKIPNKEGHHQAQLIGLYTTCSDYNTCTVTSAALSPDKKKIVLLGHSKIWLIENFNADTFGHGKITELGLNHYSQKEALSFKGNDTLLIADEREKKTGGNVYQVSLKQLKAKP